MLPLSTSLEVPSCSTPFFFLGSPHGCSKTGPR